MLRSHERFLLVTHENPDGDALGSLLAAKLGLDSLGKDAQMYLCGDAPLPNEYSFMHARRVLRGCRRTSAIGSSSRSTAPTSQRMGPDLALIERASRTIDIDHHHDNSRFGDVNLIVADASSTGEVLRDVLRELGVELTPRSRRRSTSRSSPTPGGSSTRTRRRKRSGSLPSSSRLASTSTGSSRPSTSQSTSRSSS